MKKLILVPVQKYEQLQRQANSNQQVVQIPVEHHSKESERSSQELTKEETSDNEKLDKHLILSHIPKCKKRKAETLLEYINKSPKLDWNALGEMVIEKREIPGSHISDLLRDCFTEYKNFEPVGVQEFYTNIGNIPLSLISNPKRRLTLQKGGGVEKQTKILEQCEEEVKARDKISNSKKPKKQTKSWKELWKTL
jgi:hypothetical protein